MGAKIADWTKAHPKHSAGCPAGGCYGGEAKVGGDPAIQFVTLTTTGAPDYRVDGYTQAIGDGTSVAAAKAAVLKLLPSDTKTTAFWIDSRCCRPCSARSRPGPSGRRPSCR
jgi:hypothetical protein